VDFFSTALENNLDASQRAEELLKSGWSASRSRRLASKERERGW
jgi:hypothetical protein